MQFKIMCCELKKNYVLLPLLVFFAVIPLINIKLIAYLAVVFLYNQVDFLFLLFSTLILVGVYFFEFLCEVYRDNLNLAHYVFKFQSQLQCLLAAPLKFFKSEAPGVLTERLLQLDKTLSNSLTNEFICLGEVIKLVVLTSYLAFLHFELAIFLISIIVFTLIFKLLLIYRQHVLIASHQQKTGVAANFLHEVISQFEKLKTANKCLVVQQIWWDKFLISKSYLKKLTFLDVKNLTFDKAIPIWFFLLFIVISRGDADKVELIPIFLLMNYSCLALQSICQHFNQHWHSYYSLTYFNNIPVTQENSGKPCLFFDGNVEFKNVSLKINGTSILQQISLNIKSGQFVAIVGESGSGKSSIMKLLLGFENMTEGEILIDGLSLASLNLTQLRQNFGVVLQTTTLLPGTIFSNLSFNNNITLERAWTLARLVGVANDIEQMPMKMFTYVHDSDTGSLSGGQKQKLLIARALANNPKLLLLDEATSALDAKSRRFIFSQLRDLNLTQIVITHQYDHLLDADCIYVISQGRIVAAGGYADLKAHNFL